jgi:hypothetical protein
MSMSAEFDTAVRLELYREFVRTASAPTAEALAAGMQSSTADIRAALEPDWRRATIEETEALLTSLGLTGRFWNLRA